MDHNQFKSRVEEKALVFDGAMGTALMDMGMKPSERPEILNITKPEWIEGIHYHYLLAGADVLTTNTFGANSYKLKETGYEVEEVVGAAVQCAQHARDKYEAIYGKRAYIALDLGPIGALLEPTGTLSFDDAYELYKAQIIAGAAGADFILIETQTHLLEAKCAVLAAMENANLPVFCTMSFENNGRTFTGTDVVSMVTTLEGLGVSALGVNCSFGAEGMASLVEVFLKETDLPILVQPNAGMPQIVNGITTYPFQAASFNAVMRQFIEKGVQLVGGCCGTTPEAIKLLRAISDNVPPGKRKVEKKTRIASYAQTVCIGEVPLIIGERINPTGKKKLKEALKNGDYSYIMKEACVQVSEGAHILDINVGLPEIDEAQAMTTAVKHVQSVTDVPLQLDSSNAKCLERAARLYSGKPLINSVNGKEDSLNAILPIVKKYGGCVLGLTLDEEGIPETLEERLNIARRILERALSFGIPKENVLIDCLTLTASAQQEAVYDTLYALKRVKEELGLCTVLGVSNVSFGLPARVQVHQTFFTLALDYGLDLAIINPAQKEMMWAYHAFKVLKGYDVHSASYVEIYKTVTSQQLVSPSQVEGLTLKAAIFAGLKEETRALIQKALIELPPLEVVETHLMPILNEVGKRFEEGSLYLPQLIQAAEAVGAGFEDIKKAFKKTGNVFEAQGHVILATVEHDVHDIGKNIVKVVLENYGFEVVDLGKDVPPSKVLEAIEKTGIELVGLSALMTTTVASMAETVRQVKAVYPKCKIVVGGAVLNESYAADMNADFYAKDPNEFVNFAKGIQR